VLLAGSEPLARQCLLVPFLDLDVATLQLQRSGECTAWSHTRKVLRRVYREDVAQYFGKDGRESTHVQVHRIDTHQNKPQAVLAMGPAREIWEAEEAALDIELVLGDRRRRHQLTHQPSCCPSVGLYQCCFLVRPLRVPECAMYHIQRVPQLFLFRDARLRISDQQLDDWRRINHSSVAFSEPASSGSDGLLSHTQLVVEVPVTRQRGFTSSFGPEICSQLFVVHGLRYGPG
jgi:hypothetical protein